MTDLSQMLAAFEQQIKNMQAERQGLETKIAALRLIEEELTERIGDQLKNLEVKKQVEALQQKVRKFIGDEEAA